MRIDIDRLREDLIEECNNCAFGCMGPMAWNADDIAAMNANELVILAENYGLNIKHYKAK